MFNAKDLLDVLMKGQQPAPQSQPAGQPGGFGGLGDILGQVLGGGAGQSQSAPGSSPGGSLGDILGQLQKQLGGASQAPNAAPASQPPAEGGGLGGLGDILGQLQKQLGGAAGGSAQGGGQGAGGGLGGLTDILGQVFGQATSGVREGAGRIDDATGVSGKARDVIGQMSGKSPEDLLAQLQELIKGNPMAAGAGLGGLGAVVLGTKTGRALAGSAAKLGALALIGGLAYKAFENYQNGRPLISAQERQALLSQAAPSGSGFEPDAISNESATLYIRAMIAAAASDGRIDPREQQQILGGLQQAGLGSEAQAFIQQEIQAPASVEDLAGAVSSPAEAVQVYTAARLAIDPDTGEEDEFLAALAERLGIEESLAQHIDATARAAAC